MRRNIPLVVSEIEIGLKSQRRIPVGEDLAYLASVVKNEALAVSGCVNQCTAERLRSHSLERVQKTSVGVDIRIGLIAC